MARLSNIAPERVDAVDQPATGRRWLIQKSGALLPRPAAANAATTPAPSAQAVAPTVAAAVEAAPTEKEVGAGDGSQIEQLARAAVQAVALSDQTGPDAAMAALNALATALGEAPCFPEAAATEMAKATVEAAPAAAAPSTTPADLAAAVATAVTAALVPVVKSLTAAAAAPQQPAKPAPAPSRQAQGQDAVGVKKSETPAFGEGMFADIIFAQPASAPRSDR